MFFYNRGLFIPLTANTLNMLAILFPIRLMVVFRIFAKTQEKVTDIYRKPATIAGDQSSGNCC
jgi:hypothetical protein